ncbi:MAG: hypothetical protein RL662_2194 [Bacteroidota bacterium]|jgi:capsular exopolysaccharide synthesis family protein
MNKKTKPEFVNVGDVILKYSRHWKWILLSLAIALGVGFIYIKTVDPIYYIVSNVKLRTDEEGSKVASSLVRSFGLGGVSGSDNIDDEAAIISSQSQARNMIYSLGLQASYDLKNFPFDKSLYNTSPILIEAEKSILDTLSVALKFEVEVVEDQTVIVEAFYRRKKVGQYAGALPASIKTDYGVFGMDYSKHPIADNSYDLEIVLSGLNVAAEDFRGRISVGAIDKSSNIVSLGIKDTDKQRGIDILNKLVEQYNHDTKNDKNEEAKNTANFIQERIALLGKELEILEKQLEEFKKQNKVMNMQIEAESFSTQFHDLQQKTTELDIQRNITNMLNSYVTNPKNKNELIPTNTGMPSNASESIDAYNAAILERTRLLENTTESNPIIKSLDERIAMLRENVQASVKNAQKDLSVRKKDWGSLEAEMQTRMSQMPRQEREYVELERQRKVKSELYVFLLTKMEETQLTLASTTPKAKIIDEAYGISKPVAPKKKNVLGFALLLGIMLPVMVIFIIDLFKTKIHTKEELEEATDLPILGEICLDKNANNIAVAEGVTTSTAELFRLVRTNLQFLMKKDEKVILVTSSISGEGKSFFTVNLAISFALIKNKKVALVGLDIRNPKLGEYLSIKQKNGITMYLASDDMKPEDITIHRPDLHPNISVIPAGPIPPNPGELLLGDRLDELFAHLRQHYDYIIVDTAPVGMVSDTFSLNRVADNTIYLFRANYTNKSNLKLAQTIVDEGKLNKVALVINGTTTKSAYGYGYGNVST